MKDDRGAAPPWDEEDDSFTILVLRHLDGAASPEERSTLKNQLATSAQRRRQLVDLGRLYGTLGETLAAERHERLPSEAALHRPPGRAPRANGPHRSAIAAAALLLGVLAGLVGERLDSSDRIEGTFEIREGSRWMTVRGRRAAVPGLEIRTVGSPARMTLGGRSEVDLQPATRAGILSIDPSGAIVLTQESGEAHYRVRPGSGPFEVRTPAASVHVQGTEFQILMKGEGPMKKGTALGATLAAVVGVSSGIVAVRNTHGEIRVPAGSTATATAAAAPKLSAESQTRIRLLETERTTIARRVKDDLTQLQELDRREKELESATPPPKKASKGDSMKALVSVNLRLEAKRDAANFQKILGLTDEQTARLEELSVKLWSDIFGGAIAETLSIEDLERVTSAKESYEQAFREFLTEEQRRKLTASGMLFGPPEFKPPVSAYEALLKDLDPETQARAKREMSRVVMAANTLFTRAHCLKTGLEFAELLDELVPRYEVRMKQILPADRAASLEAILRQLTIAARKKMENSDGKK